MKCGGWGEKGESYVWWDEHFMGIFFLTKAEARRWYRRRGDINMFSLSTENLSQTLGDEIRQTEPPRQK